MRLDDAYDLLQQFDEARNADDVDRTIERIVGPFGVSSFLMGTMPPPGASPEEQMQHLLLAAWPGDWTERYFHEGYLELDPTIHHVRTKTLPADWRAVRRNERGRNLVMNEAGDFRLHDGITIPQMTLGGIKLGISFAGERVDLDHPEFRTIATTTAAYASAAALRLHKLGNSERRVRLSERETEALKWAAAGRTGQETADIMGITLVTVDKHMQRAKTKLRAFTKAHAVAEALRQGILD